MGAKVTLLYTTHRVVSMSDRTQIGPAVDADLWQRFRDDVESRKGQVRGVLGDELENAIREHLNDNPSPEQKEINARLTRIESKLGVTEADGGVDTSDAQSHTHAPSRVESATEEKPPANAASEKKVRYLAESLIEQEVPNSREIEQIPKATLREVVKDEYGFRSDTAQRYVDELRDWFNLVQHPNIEKLLVSTGERERLLAEKREQLKQEAEEKL